MKKSSLIQSFLFIIRNGQLTKRVSVLQEELDTMSKKKNKNSKGQSNNVTSKDIASIHIEELESKIREVNY